MQNVSSDILSLVSTRQTRLHNYQSHDTGQTLFHDVLPSPKQLRMITSVELFISNEQQCSVAQQVLQYARNIRRLSLRISMGSMQYNSRRGNVEPTLQSYLAVVKRILGRDAADGGGDTTQPLQLRLRDLVLTDIPAGECSAVLFDVIDPATLEALETSGCADVFILHKYLAGKTRALRRLANSDSLNVEQGEPEGMERLLTNATGIETIRSAERNLAESFPICSWAAIQRQGPTLRVLEIDHAQSTCNTSDAQALDAFADMCTHCPHLQEMAIALPPPVWWPAFLVRAGLHLRRSIALY